MTRICLEATALASGAGARGTGRYIRAVLEANALLGNEVVQIAGSARSGRATEFLSLPHRTLHARRAGCAIYHAPTPSYAVSTRIVPNQVVSILDTIPLESPDYIRTGLKSRFFFKLAAQAPSILTLSHHAAARITELLGVDPDRITVASLPVSQAFRLEGQSGLPRERPYVAMIADLRYPDPHKRLDWIPMVASSLNSRGIDTVVAGHGTQDWRTDIPGLVGLGYVADEDWAATLRSALAFVNVSAFEGQGMAQLEAVSCGTPVVSPINSAIPEMVGDAGVLVEETSALRADHEVVADLVGAVESLCLDQGLGGGLREKCRTVVGKLPTIGSFASQIDLAYGRLTK